jgi:hypothetical protein
VLFGELCAHGKTPFQLWGHGVQSACVSLCVCQ